MEITKSGDIKELATALAEAQGEMKAVVMNAVNPFLKNKYADLGAIVETSKPVLSKHGLSVSQLPFTEDSKIGLDTILMHSSGQYLASRMSFPVGEEKGKNLLQSVGSIITYMRRYSLSAILGIHTEEDEDGTDKKAKKGVEKTEAESEEDKKLALIKETQAKILAMLNELGGSKNEKLMELLHKYIESANPMKIKDQEKLNKLMADLETFKKEKVG